MQITHPASDPRHPEQTDPLPVAPLHVAPLHTDPLYIDRAIARIRAYRQAQGWSINRLASEAGMNESALRRLDDPDWNPEARTLRKLERLVPATFKTPRLKVSKSKPSKSEASRSRPAKAMRHASAKSGRG